MLFASNHFSVGCDCKKGCVLLYERFGGKRSDCSFSIIWITSLPFLKYTSILVEWPPTSTKACRGWIQLKHNAIQIITWTDILDVDQDTFWGFQTYCSGFGLGQTLLSAAFGRGSFTRLNTEPLPAPLRRFTPLSPMSQGTTKRLASTQGKDKSGVTKG